MNCRATTDGAEGENVEEKNGKLIFIRVWLPDYKSKRESSRINGRQIQMCVAKFFIRLHNCSLTVHGQHLETLRRTIPKSNSAALKAVLLMSELNRRQEPVQNM